MVEFREVRGGGGVIAKAGGAVSTNALRNGHREPSGIEWITMSPALLENKSRIRSAQR
ncbi:MAG TPA: hypothetical protein VND89_11725 [Acidimicrobiales bacterium]|nr:hypothetical protein [Acidimicrobiales bacterium]